MRDTTSSYALSLKSIAPGIGTMMMCECEGLSRRGTGLLLPYLCHNPHVTQLTPPTKSVAINFFTCSWAEVTNQNVEWSLGSAERPHSLECC